MNPQELRDFLALWHIQGLGPATQKKILELYPDLREFFALPSKELKEIGFSDTVIAQINNPDWKQVDRALLWADKPNHSIVTFLCPAYPPQLHEIQSAPTLLFTKGILTSLSYSQLAIVGSRNPTEPGKHIAKTYASFLAQQGLSIVSGMALGIDRMAHEGALSCQGKTIAVFGTGIDVIYPNTHQKLADKICEQGLLVSEFPLGMQAYAHHFPLRNRIISGLSLGTFVVEAAIKSGSLITARYALDQGREVFAMPSSVHNPMAKGCHLLIKQGAHLVESVEDIWEALKNQSLKLYLNQIINNEALDFEQKQPHINYKLSKVQQQLLTLIGFDRMGVDTLLQQTTLSSHELSVTLLELELLGYLEAVPGGYQKKVK